MPDHPSRPSSPMAALLPQDITGLILAGGRGTRMGAVDKGLQTLNGQPLVAHAHARLQAQVGQVMINANQNLEQYRQLGLPVWPDQIAGHVGPLAGMAVGMQHCPGNWLLSVPCDSPIFPLDLAARLARAVQAENALLALAVTREQRGGEWIEQDQPVFCLLHTSLLPHLIRFLESGGRKITAWYADLPVTRVMFDDAHAFSNLNTLDELAQAATLLAPETATASATTSTTNLPA